jgi:protein-tyrosine phosphatase
VIIIPDANEVLPRIWIGPVSSCAQAPEGVVCFNVLETPHSECCRHCRILGDDGKARIELLDHVAQQIDVAWNTDTRHLLVHCGAGVERSPLTVAWWMTKRLHLTFDEAYAWLKRQRPQIEDRRSWIEG